jgi:hypothetical protein
VWLVPSTVLAARTKPNRQNRHRFAASLKPGTNDQWREYRMSRSDLPTRILAWTPSPSVPGSAVDSKNPGKRTSATRLALQPTRRAQSSPQATP